MKNIIVGTAGHIDHGKTTLIKALTGKETDRWEEEKKRGITIDLGFAYFDLPNGNRIGIIDVPGHEKFIKNMLAGVVGMDLVLLVIAADEGIMPQTQEHVNILSMTGLKNGIVVLTKCDTVDKEWVGMIKEDIKKELEDTFLGNAPIVEVSSVTGEGIGELVKAIEEATSNRVEQRDITTIPRLPIDRAFTISGFGTVITGTLISGQIKKGEDLEVYPINSVCKVRNIQVHGEDEDICYAGQRVAINLSNIKKSQLYRGCVLAPINSMKDTMMLDVKISLLKTSKRVVENRSRLHFYTGTSEILCRIVLLDKETLSPGESCYAQLRLEEKVAVRRGDRFVVRFYSPMETIGGGEIIEPVPQKKARANEDTIEELKVKEKGSPIEVIEKIIKEKSANIPSLNDIAKITAMSTEEVVECANELDEQGKIAILNVKKDMYFWHCDYEKYIEKRIIDYIDEYHKKNPYKLGVKKSELKSKFFTNLKQNVFDELMEGFVKKQVFTQTNDILSSVGFQVVKDKKYEIISGKIIKLLGDFQLNFPRLSQIMELDNDKKSTEDILNYLLGTGYAICIAEDTYVLSSDVEKAKNTIVEAIDKNGKITVGELRDLLNTSRKNAVTLLEYFDSIRLTKRVENDRILY